MNSLFFCLLLTVYCSLAACAPIQLTRPVTKLGLVAPFEGTQRALGYEALYAVKLALREKNAGGGVAGWFVELVALDAGDQPSQALRQARVLAADPDVMLALVLRDAGESAAVEAQYRELRLPLALFDARPDESQSIPAAFVERYRAASGGFAPSPLAARAYTAAQTALTIIEQRIRAQSKPTR